MTADSPTMPRQNAKMGRTRQNSGYELQRSLKTETAVTRKRGAIEGVSEKSLRRAIAKAERRDGTGQPIGGTGLTYLKMEASAIGRLIDSGRIGAVELRAADEICGAYLAICDGMLIRSPSVERVDRGQPRPEPAWLIDAQRRYRHWAEFWSTRAKLRHDRTLEIVVAAVVDDRSMRGLEREFCLRNGAASPMVVAGLQDYAARAGWCDATTTMAWMAV